MISNCTPTNSPKDTAYRQSEDLKIEKMEKDEIFACYDKLEDQLIPWAKENAQYIDWTFQHDLEPGRGATGMPEDIGEI
ncbi:hypothetical protein RB195_015169 [Necator americanus]|uniref:Uncharacterized protein n=1 Tax=Necator americanus TaxID=51031 RepID=A0ABR1E3A5_NECAM